MALPFEFVIDGPPVSQQARRRELLRQWSENVRRVGKQYWEMDDEPVAESVMLTITYFFTDRQMDVDNIPKPISDALNGLVYIDDNQITDILFRKRNLNDDLRIENSSGILRQAVVRNIPFVYIRVENAPDQSLIW
ncbi:MAG: RusA family crossover junction endodeoxyribonuclease [Chloroflexota bacterium]|nr:RusA family crossover junction endodeoxyribonuclease [Chloroflexota bacterium]